MTDSLSDAARREVIELHAFFEGWLGGTILESDEAFARVEAALGPGFSMVTPEGDIVSRAEVIAELRRGHGAKGKLGAFRIAVEEIEVLHGEPPLVALRYVEDQRQGEACTIRRSTAFFRASPRSPSGAEWVGLHETWIRPPS